MCNVLPQHENLTSPHSDVVSATDTQLAHPGWVFAFVSVVLKGRFVMSIIAKSSRHLRIGALACALAGSMAVSASAETGMMSHYSGLGVTAEASSSTRP